MRNLIISFAIAFAMTSLFTAMLGVQDYYTAPWLSGSWINPTDENTPMTLSRKGSTDVA